MHRNTIYTVYTIQWVQFIHLCAAKAFLCVCACICVCKVCMMCMHLVCVSPFMYAGGSCYIDDVHHRAAHSVCGDWRDLQ